MWSKESNKFFRKIENFAYGEINERSFSTPPPLICNSRHLWVQYSLLGVQYPAETVPLCPMAVIGRTCVHERLRPYAWWRHQMEAFSALLAICAGNSPVTGEFPHKGQWRGALMFSLICVWINGWVNNRDPADLRRYRTHCDVTVMGRPKCPQSVEWLYLQYTPRDMNTAHLCCVRWWFHTCRRVLSMSFKSTSLTQLGDCPIASNPE